MPFIKLLVSVFNFFFSLCERGESLAVGAVLDPAVKVSAVSDKSSVNKTFSLALYNLCVKKMPAASLIWRDKGPAPNAPGHPQQNNSKRINMLMIKIEENVQIEISQH